MHIRGMAVIAAPIFQIPLTTRTQFNFFFPRTKCTHTHGAGCTLHIPNDKKKNTSCSSSTTRIRGIVQCEQKKKNENRSHNLNGRRTYAKHHMYFIFFFWNETDFCSDAFSFPWFFFFVFFVQCCTLPIATNEKGKNMNRVASPSYVVASHLVWFLFVLILFFSAHFFAWMKKNWFPSGNRVIDMFYGHRRPVHHIFPFLLIHIFVCPELNRCRQTHNNFFLPHTPLRITDEKKSIFR